MSVRGFLIEIACDGPSSGGGCPNQHAWTDSGPEGTLRARMRREGWATGLPGGVDRCHECRSPLIRGCATSNPVARPTESDGPPVGGWGLWPTFRHTESIKEEA